MSRYTPKLLVCLREGYTRHHFFSDLAAGITVGIIALPLAMAFGIASLAAREPLTILGAEMIDTSYPGFYHAFKNRVRTR